MKNLIKPAFLVVFYLIIAIFVALSITSCDTSDKKSDQEIIEEKWSHYKRFEIINGQKVPVGSGVKPGSQPSVEPNPQVLPEPSPDAQPDPTPPTTTSTEDGKTKKTFTWSYRGQSYTLDVSLNNSLDYNRQQENFYNEEDYYSKFLLTKPNDNSVRELAQKLRALAATHNLNDDQFLELLAAFVQSIPYAATNNPGTPKYPYQTLKDGVGDCDDKSLLTYKIMAEEGYDVALISYPSHMAVGVGCPRDVSFNNTGFAYLEVVGPNKDAIGRVPDNWKGRSFQIFLPRTGGKIYRSLNKLS